MFYELRSLKGNIVSEKLRVILNHVIKTMQFLAYFLMSYVD